MYPTSGQSLEFVLVDAFGSLRQRGKMTSHIKKREASAEAGELTSVVTMSSMDLLQEAWSPREIDYLSIDTEGSELAILEAIDSKRYLFRCTMVEHNFKDQREAQVH